LASFTTTCRRKEQVKEVARVKRHIHGLIQDPITVTPEQHLGDVLAMIDQRRFEFRTFPVVDSQGKLVGLLSGATVRERYRSKKVSEAMVPRKDILTVHERTLQPDPIAAADTFFTENVGIHKMLVVDDADRLRGLVTFSDVERITAEAKSRRKPARDSEFRLVVGAAIAPVRKPDGSLDRDRMITHVGHLMDESIDAVAVSTAHGHSAGVGDIVKMLRDAFPRPDTDRRKRHQRRGRQISRRLRCQRDQGGSGPRVHLHDPNCSRSRHSSTHRPLRRERGRRGMRGQDHR
jgi:IMP dehydrogenase